MQTGVEFREGKGALTIGQNVYCAIKVSRAIQVSGAGSKRNRKPTLWFSGSGRNGQLGWQTVYETMH